MSLSRRYPITIRMGAPCWCVTIRDPAAPTAPLHFDIRSMDRHQRGRFFGQFHQAVRRHLKKAA